MNVAIIGASGYTGLELIKILINHPKFNISYVANSSGDINVQDLHPCLKSVINIDVELANAVEVAKVAELAFLALPHKTSMAFAKELLSLGVKVVDLSADYRLSLENYEKHYCEHEDKENIENAVLIPITTQIFHLVFSIFRFLPASVSEKLKIMLLLIKYRSRL